MPQCLRTDLIFVPAAAAEGKPPLFFIHGVLHGAWCWETWFIPYFTRAGYDCYAIDLPGHGRQSVHSINRITFSDYINAICEAVKVLPEPPVLVGHSMGGLLIQKVMERLQPRGAVLLAPLPKRGIGPSVWRILRHDPLHFLHALLTLDMRKAFRSTAQVRWAMYSERIDREVLDHYRNNMGPESFLAFLGMLLPRVRLTKAQRIPTLLVAAGNDRLISMRDWQVTAHYLSATLEEIHEAPHNLMLDPCWPRVAERVDIWLQTTFND